MVMLFHFRFGARAIGGLDHSWIPTSGLRYSELFQVPKKPGAFIGLLSCPSLRVDQLISPVTHLQRIDQNSEPCNRFEFGLGDADRIGS